MVAKLTSNKILISIVGPTAIGKTSLSIKLAQHFKTEIISADSRQFYKEMQIGTAAPTSSELKKAKHHFIHHKSIADHYNVGAFEKDAIRVISHLFKTHSIVIMVGGSGLYVDAVTTGLDDFPEVDANIRVELNHTFQKDGILPLQKQLKVLDIDAYNTIAIDNPHRLIRALEICIGTHKPYSSYLKKEKKHRNFQTITIGLTAERSVIYDRINLRVDNMLNEGLLDEVESLIHMKHLNALNTVGYKELFNFFDGTWTLDFAISEIKKNSRRFAKRQLTWFKKDKDLIWFNFDVNFDTILDVINTKLKS